MAPETFAGIPPSAQSDVYALGVLLYQLSIGDLRKPVAVGWERAIEDPVLRDDIAEAAWGDPAGRLESVAELGRRVRTLSQRSLERSRADEAGQRAQAAEGKRRRTRLSLFWTVLAAVALAVSAAGLYWRQLPPPPVRILKTVAVLPFQNVGTDRSLDFLSQALPDEIATCLSYAPSLSIRPPRTR